MEGNILKKISRNPNGVQRLLITPEEVEAMRHWLSSNGIANTDIMDKDDIIKQFVEKQLHNIQ